MAKHDFLYPEQTHKLSEMECELVSFYRFLSPTKQQAVMRMMFDLVSQDKKIDSYLKKQATADD